jgi:transposase
MSTLKDEKSTVDIIRPSIGKRGPKKIELPEDEIKQLHKGGMGAKAIASWLKIAYSIKVSYKTIQRLLSDERS